LRQSASRIAWFVPFRRNTLTSNLCCVNIFFLARANKFVGRMSCLDFEFSKEPMRELERARWRCRRGLLELDIVLQRFMDEHYARLGETELRQFEMLLDLSDNDLWEMIALRKETENRSLQPVLHLLQTI
jgi:antitoxin CptB